MMRRSFDSIAGKSPLGCRTFCGIPCPTQNCSVQRPLEISTTLPGSLGVMAFAPCVLAPADPAGFVAVDGAGLGLCGGPGGPALPLTITAPPIGAPIRITLQAVVAVSATDWQVSNGLIFNVP